MGYPQFNLRNSPPPPPPPPEPPFPTAAEIALLRILAEQRAEHAARFLYQSPPKLMRYSKSGVPLVKEKE
jgi:hypothetical protein